MTEYKGWPNKNSSLFKRIVCRILHGKRNWRWHRGPMGWIDWDECTQCGAVHNVG